MATGFKENAIDAAVRGVRDKNDDSSSDFAPFVRMDVLHDIVSSL